MLSVRELFFRVKGALKPCIVGLSFDLAEGEILAVVADRTEKNMLMRVLGGFEAFTCGVVEANGKVLRGKSFVGRIAPPFRFLELVPEETVHFSSVKTAKFDAKKAAKLEARALELLTQAGLAALAHGPASALTTEQRQQVALIRALMIEPLALIYQAPKNTVTDAAQWAFDPSPEQLKWVQSLGVPQLVITDNEALARSLATRVMRFTNKRLVPM